MAKELSEPVLGSTKWKGADRWLSDGGSRGAGRLVAKVSAAANGTAKPGTRITFYFSYFTSEGRRRFFPIGEHGKGAGKIALADARERASKLSAEYRKGIDPIEHHADQRAADEQGRKAAKEAAEQAERRARSQTLRELLDAYTGHLAREGKQSAGNVRSIFKLHVLDLGPTGKDDHRPRLADQRAADIPPDDFVSLLGALTKAGKGRTAAKLRSYLRAAYALAISAKTDPDAPLELRTFGISFNPLASLAALSKYNRTRDRNLNAEELKGFLARLHAMPATPKRDALELALLLGGQRPTQLLRLRPVDVDLSAGTVTLYDSKGRRQQPRAHVLPLTTQAAAIVKRAIDQHGDCATVFSIDGKRPLRAETVSVAMSELSASMVKAKEAREPFQLRDVRRTCETMLAGLGVSSDVRAQVQSHGLGGVQNRHYDRHSYALEKRNALTQWERQLARIEAGEVAPVLALPKAAQGKAA